MNLENQILNRTKVLQKIRRIAYEITEQNFDEKELVLVGVVDNGYLLAQLLSEELKKIGQFKVELYKVELNKKTPLQSDILLEVDIESLNEKSVLLVDDVLYTGRTLAYSLKPFLNTRIKKLQTAILIDRDHKTFPIAADYVGYALSTTLKEHVTVELVDESKFGVYLT